MTSGRVLLLGAGFSRAVSDDMPLTDDLGELVVDRLDARASALGWAPFRTGSFERWMSHLAQDQPFLTDAANMQNRAMFLKVSEAVAEVLGESVTGVLASGRPEWLTRFTKLAHVNRSTVITFNYDTLIESASVQLLQDRESAQPVYWAELLQDVPSWPPGAARYAPSRAETMRLLKLHGSLNWYWSPADPTGTSVARRDLPGHFGSPQPYTEGDRRRELPGRVPFVVPPATSKSIFYAIPLLRDIWAQALEALSSASDVALIGYSLPSGDLTVADLFRIGLARGNQRVSIVDPHPAGIVSRLTELGVAGERIEVVDTPDPVVTFVDSWAWSTGVGLVSRLGADGDHLRHPVAVRWTDREMAAIVRVDDDGVLVVDAIAPQNVATVARKELLPTLGQILEHGSDRPLRVRLPDGSLQTAVDATTGHYSIGYGTGDWHLLTTDGACPTHPSGGWQNWHP